MTRLLAPAVALALLAAGCGAVRYSAEVRIPPRSTRSVILVTVVDGDTHRLVVGARVRIGAGSAVSDEHGLARVRVPLRRTSPVTASAPGFEPHTVVEPLAGFRQVTIRLFQPGLQWTMYGAGPARTQAQSLIRLRPPFRTVWSAETGGLVEFPAVVADGVAYVAAFDGTVSALDMRDGSLVWRRDTGAGKMAASPAVVGDALVVHGMDGRVRVLDRGTGRTRFAYSVGSPIESSPLVVGGVDYFGAWDGRVYALDLRARRLRWTYSAGAKITSSAALSGGTLYIGDYAGMLLALDPATGRLRFARGVNGRIYGTPAVADGRVFVPSSDGGSLSAFATDGRPLWRVTTGSYVYSSPAVSAGRVFFGSYDGIFRAVSAATGRTLWQVGTGGPISGAAVVVDGVAYAGSFGHEVLGVDAGSGRVVLRFPHGEYVPVSGNGGRLLLHGYSQLYAVEPRR